MSAPRPALEATPWRLAICRFAPDAPLPAWMLHAEAQFWSLTRTPDELSVVCAEDDLPPSVRAHAECGWRAFRVAGPLALDVPGVVAALTGPLAAAGVPVFVISTHDTDVLLVRAGDEPRARALLAGAFELRG